MEADRGGGRCGFAPSAKNRPATRTTNTARYARLSKIDLVKAAAAAAASKSVIVATRKSHLYPSYLSTLARSRKVAFRAHLPVVYLSPGDGIKRARAHRLWYLCRSPSVSESARRSAVIQPARQSSLLERPQRRRQRAGGGATTTMTTTAWRATRFDTGRFEPLHYHASTYYVKHRASGSRARARRDVAGNAFRRGYQTF